MKLLIKLFLVLVFVLWGLPILVPIALVTMNSTPVVSLVIFAFLGLLLLIIFKWWFEGWKRRGSLLPLYLYENYFNESSRISLALSASISSAPDIFASAVVSRSSWSTISFVGNDNASSFAKVRTFLEWLDSVPSILSGSPRTIVLHFWHFSHFKRYSMSSLVGMVVWLKQKDSTEKASPHLRVP